MTTYERHSSEVRRQAQAYFEEGLGYKAAATRLNISQSTTRDWHRQWTKGQFQQTEGNRRTTPYSEEIRRMAQTCFAEGLGYKATATKLGIPESITRDWRRQWMQGCFRRNNETFAQALRQVMLEANVRFVCRNDSNLLAEAYKRIRGYEETPRAMALSVLESVKNSELFIRLPMYVRNARNSAIPVFSLKAPPSSNAENYICESQRAAFA